MVKSRTFARIWVSGDTDVRAPGTSITVSKKIFSAVLP
jgi:hypothetical protein